MIAGINDIYLTISSDTDAFGAIKQNVVHAFTERIKNLIDEITVLDPIVPSVCDIETVTSLETQRYVCRMIELARLPPTTSKFGDKPSSPINHLDSIVPCVSYIDPLPFIYR